MTKLAMRLSEYEQQSFQRQGERISPTTLTANTYQSKAPRMIKTLFRDTNRKINHFATSLP
jgi:hypothetical protein